VPLKVVGVCENVCSLAGSSFSHSFDEFKDPVNSQLRFSAALSHSNHIIRNIENREIVDPTEEIVFHVV
jgi:hypothetical protein